MSRQQTWLWDQFGGGASWAPLDDVPITSGLYLPGGYSTPTSATGQWLDESGNGRHFLYNVGLIGGASATAPIAHARGYPIFDGVDGGLVCAGKSFASDFSAPDNGAIVAIVQYRNRLESSSGTYTNTSVVMGAGATPGLVIDDSGVRLEGFDTLGYTTSTAPGFHAYASTLIAGKWDGVGTYASNAGGAWSAAFPYNAGMVSLDGTNMGADVYIGMGYGASSQPRGVIKAVAFYPNAADVDDAKLAQWQAWAIAQGLVSAWSPRADAATASMLFMPGDYDPAGGGGFGTWKDSSTNAFDSNAGGGTIEDFGSPSFNGTDRITVVGHSLATDLALPDNGTLIAISKQTTLPTFDGTTYNTPGLISGSGASPLIAQDDTGAATSGFDLTDYTIALAPSGVAAASVPHIQFGAWDNVGMYAACDENAFSAVAPYHPGRTELSPDNIGANTYIGASFGGNFTGTIYLAAVYPTKQSDAKVAQWRAWALLEELVSSFNPLALPLASGVAKVWYDAAHQTNGAGIITALPDRSGNGCSGVIFAGNEPKFTATNAAFNNLPTMDFSPDTDLRFVDTGDLGIASGAPFTYVLIANGVGDFVMSSHTNVSIYAIGATVTATGDAGATNLSDGITVVGTTPSVIVFVANGVSSKLYVNAKTPRATGNAGAQDIGTSPNRIVRLGMLGTGILAAWNQNGSTAHALVYDGALSQADVEYLLTGFGALAGVAIGP